MLRWDVTILADLSNRLSVLPTVAISIHAIGSSCHPLGTGEVEDICKFGKRDPLLAPVFTYLSRSVFHPQKRRNNSGIRTLENGESQSEWLKQVWIYHCKSRNLPASYVSSLCDTKAGLHSCSPRLGSASYNLWICSCFSSGSLISRKTVRGWYFSYSLLRPFVSFVKTLMCCSHSPRRDVELHPWTPMQLMMNVFGEFAITFILRRFYSYGIIILPTSNWNIVRFIRLFAIDATASMLYRCMARWLAPFSPWRGTT